MPASAIPAHRPELPRYQETAPSPALTRWVASYWTIRATGTLPVLNRVLPDGCVDVIVGLVDEPRAHVVGAMRTAVVVPLAGAVDLFGIRFRPGAALPFLDAPLSGLTDRRVPLDDLWGGVGATLACAISSATSTAERVALVERILLQRLPAWADDRRGDESLAAEAVRLMTEGRSAVRVNQLALALGVGERRLERAFHRSVGLTPKFLGRVLRFRRAVRAIERRCGGGVPIAWSGVAFDAGYADQSHLIREFRQLAGVTPVQLAGERSTVAFVQDDGMDVV